MTRAQPRPDYYRVLQVDRSASPEVIEKAYKALARKAHPDTHDARDRAEATPRMQLLNEAYRVLSDKALRDEYDFRGRARALELFLEDGLLGLYRKRREFLR